LWGLNKINMAKKEKTKHYRVLILNEDFGNNKKGDSLRCETSLAARLIERNVGVLINGEVSDNAIIDEVKEVKTKQIKQKKK
jgi:hypothetical protein